MRPQQLPSVFATHGPTGHPAPAPLFLDPRDGIIISSVFARKSTYNVILAFIFISGFDCLICLSYHKRFVGIGLGLGRDDGQEKGKHADAMKTRQSRADRAHVNI